MYWTTLLPMVLGRVPEPSVDSDRYEMPGTSLGIFWIDLLLKPVLKGVMKSPELALLALLAVYGCIAYRCLKSAYIDG